MWWEWTTWTFQLCCVWKAMSPTKLEQCSTRVVYPPWYFVSTYMDTIHTRILWFRQSPWDASGTRVALLGHATWQWNFGFLFKNPVRTCLISRGWTEYAWQLNGDISHNLLLLTFIYFYGIPRMHVLKRPQKVLSDAMLSNDCKWKELPFCCSLLQRNVIPEESRQMCSVWRRLLVYWAT